jgi:hypothetical protein
MLFSDATLISGLLMPPTEYEYLMKRAEVRGRCFVR